MHKKYTQEILKSIFTDQQEDFDRTQKSTSIIEREQTTFIRNQTKRAHALIKVVLGVRRSGKSTLCQQILKGDNVLYVNFDDERLFGLRSDNLQDVLEASLSLKPSAQILLLDEIQNIDGWELFVNRLQRSGYDIWITGSNAHLLSKELATHLTGRTLQFEVFPFSFSEWIRFSKQDELLKKSEYSTNERVILKNQLQIYFEQGGFPEVLKGAPRNLYLQSLFDQIISRDIVLRYNVKRPRELKELGLMLSDSIATRMSHQQISRSLSLKSAHTVKKYLRYFEEAYLFFELRNFTVKLKERTKFPRKIYAIDLGMIEAISSKPNLDLGHRLENLVFLALRQSGQDLFCWSDDYFEIDFVVRSGRKITHLIQVCYDLTSEQTAHRELTALERALSYARDAKPIIITWDQEKTFLLGQHQIVTTPIWKFLTL